MSENKIRVAFIGCGGNARGHGRRIAAAPDAEIVGICDVSEAAMQAFRENVGVDAKVPAFTDYQDMLASIKPDAVEISTPHTLHFQQITECSFQCQALCHRNLHRRLVQTLPVVHWTVGRLVEAGYFPSFQPSIQN